MILIYTNANSGNRHVRLIQAVVKRPKFHSRPTAGTPRPLTLAKEKKPAAYGNIMRRRGSMDWWMGSAGNRRRCAFGGMKRSNQRLGTMNDNDIWI